MQWQPVDFARQLRVFFHSADLERDRIPDQALVAVEPASIHFNASLTSYLVIVKSLCTYRLSVPNVTTSPNTSRERLVSSEPPAVSRERDKSMYMLPMSSISRMYRTGEPGNPQLVELDLTQIRHQVPNKLGTRGTCPHGHTSAERLERELEC